LVVENGSQSHEESALVPSTLIALILQSAVLPVTGVTSGTGPGRSTSDVAGATVASAPMVEREAWAMGTRVRVVAEGDAGLARTEVVLAEVERFDGLLSTWTPTTPLSRLNRAPVGAEVDLSSEVHGLLLEADRWAHATEGAFDPRIGSLIDAWDLRGAGRVPSADLLRQARAASGARAWRIDEGRPVVTRESERAWIDTGGFGKGAALRAAAERLSAEGPVSGRILADLGGQVWAEAPAERPWRVPVAHPDDRATPAAWLLLHDVSAATSGTSERWIEVDGRRYGHIVDPRTGWPVPAWGTVTVVHPDALVADVLATALYVMGPGEGMLWLERRPEVPALFLEPHEGRLQARWTPAMERWLDDPHALRPDALARSGALPAAARSPAPLCHAPPVP
jgi:thiamine biosynthesis lipoprotein